LGTTVRGLRCVLGRLLENSDAAEVEEAAWAVGQLSTPFRDMQVLAEFLEEQVLMYESFKRYQYLETNCLGV
ncbi:metal-chelation protein CHAD, partial [Pseudomonas syringae pv. tagetis]